MKIIALQIENFLNIKAISMKIEGNTVVLSGANGAGKSAVLDAIQAVLGGKKPEDMIKHGEERAEVVVETEEFTARRIITAKTDRLMVTNKEGDVKKSPSQFLESVIGKLSFDPLEFANMKEREQRDLLADLVGLDFSDIKTAFEKAYEERTGINSQLDSVIAKLKDLPVPDENTPVEEIIFKSELEKVNQLRGKRDAFTQVQKQKNYILKDISTNNNEIGRIRARIRDLETMISSLEDKNRGLADQEKGMELPPEVTEQQVKEAESALAEIEAKNTAIREANNYRALKQEEADLAERGKKLTETLLDLKKQKADRISQAKYPIPGLSINDDSVFYNDIRFSQLSTGQKLRVSTAIGMAENPKLRTLFVRNASLLDSIGRKEIIDTAQAQSKPGEQQYTVFFEITREKDENGEYPPVGFYLENGDIVAVNGKKVQKQSAPVEAAK